MINTLSFKSANTILYCKKWRETVYFYKHRLGLPITFASDWFVEFRLTDTAHLSIAHEQRATIKSCGGAGLTLTILEGEVTVVAGEAKTQLGPGCLVFVPASEARGSNQFVQPFFV